jgi:hypothetical protein
MSSKTWAVRVRVLRVEPRATDKRPTMDESVDLALEDFEEVTVNDGRSF